MGNQVETGCSENECAHAARFVEKRSRGWRTAALRLEGLSESNLTQVFSLTHIRLQAMLFVSFLTHAHTHVRAFDLCAQVAHCQPARGHDLPLGGGRGGSVKPLPSVARSRARAAECRRMESPQEREPAAAAWG